MAFVRTIDPVNGKTIAMIHTLCKHAYETVRDRISIQGEMEKVLIGEVVGDEDVWYDVDEYLIGGDHGDDDYDPGGDADDRSSVVTSPVWASGSSSGWASDYPSEFSAILPCANAPVWSWIPDGMVTDAPDTGTLARLR